MKQPYNPWLGLLSYQDPLKSSREYVFCGRDNAIGSIFAMVNNNLLVTLYGKTGIGKTSILNAGVFPLLRSQNYFPIAIRLGGIEGDNRLSFAERIVRSIYDELEDAGGRVRTQHPDVISLNNQSGDYLWRFFCTSTFLNKDNEEVFPVIALDQLEEIFLLHPNEAGVLLRQINALIDDNREIPSVEGYEDNTNFRFILSIREDDLFYLEDCIDSNKLPEMKENRYRLAPLNDIEASDIIRLGRQFMPQKDEEEIIRKILKIVKDENGRISTNILSLVCSQLYIRSEGHITLAQVDDSQEDPLEDFYRKCMMQVSSDTKGYIEEHLVDGDRRKFVLKEEFKSHVSESDRKTLMTGEYKIIQDVTAGNTKCVELIHDSLARTINRIKLDAEELAESLRVQKHNRLIKRLMYAFLSFLLCSIVLIAYLFLLGKQERAERGMGVHQQFVISLSEDSMVIADNDFWKANLRVFSEEDSSGLTVEKKILDTMINKAIVSNTYTFSTDSAKAFHIIVDFGENIRYENIDEFYTIGQLTENASIAMVIKLKKAKLISYSGRVLMRLVGKRVKNQGVKDAIVVLHDKIQRTDDEGYFNFNLEDSVNPGDVLYIIKKGFTIVEDSNVVVLGKMKERFFISPADSLSYFELRCAEMDTLTRRWRWEYSTIKEKHPGGTTYYHKSGKIDTVAFFARTIGKIDEKKFKIEGYYYLRSEYNIQESHKKACLSYWLCSGWMDSQNLVDSKEKYKSFELDCYDSNNNLQRIVGKYWHTGELSGEILNSKGTIIGRFGKDDSRGADPEK